MADWKYSRLDSSPINQILHNDCFSLVVFVFVFARTPSVQLWLQLLVSVFFVRLILLFFFFFLSVCFQVWIFFLLQGLQSAVASCLPPGWVWITAQSVVPAGKNKQLGEPKKKRKRKNERRERRRGGSPSVWGVMLAAGYAGLINPSTASTNSATRHQHNFVQSWCTRPRFTSQPHVGAELMLVICWFSSGGVQQNQTTFTHKKSELTQLWLICG